MLICRHVWPAILTLCAPVLAAAAAGPAPVRLAVTDPKVLLLAAIDAADGRADGVLTGELAGAITRRFSATSPLYIDVTTLFRYEQAGCRRLNVRFWQDGVRIGTTVPPSLQTLDLALNFCRNGLPPASLRREQQP